MNIPSLSRPFAWKFLSLVVVVILTGCRATHDRAGADGAASDNGDAEGDSSWMADDAGSPVDATVDSSDDAEDFADGGDVVNADADVGPAGCATAADCRPTRWCEPEFGCREPGECEDDWQCPVGHLCPYRGAECRCLNDDSCVDWPDGQTMCNLDTGKCEVPRPKECTDDQECEAQCSPDQGVCGYISCTCTRKFGLCATRICGGTWICKEGLVCENIFKIGCTKKCTWTEDCVDEVGRMYACADVCRCGTPTCCNPRCENGKHCDEPTCSCK